MMRRLTCVVAVFLVACLPATCLCLHSLTPVAYLQLPTSVTTKGQLRYEGLNRQAALDGAYDVNNNILYVIGSRLLHVVDIADPSHPSIIFTHQVPADKGNLKAVAVCGDEVAVAMDNKVMVVPGKVVFYRTHIAGDNITEMTEIWNATVGSSPVNLQYTTDCHKLLVANAGEAGKDAQGVYQDPQGTVTILDTSGHGAGGAAQVEVDFTDYDYGQPRYNPAVRAPSMHIPYTTLQLRTLLSKDTEPSHVTLSPDGTTGWVSLPENNAIARFDVGTGRVTSVTSMPLKDWSNSPIDTSDEDGGVHRRLYKDLFSLRQPTVIKTVAAGGKTYLITADTGAVKTYTRAKHGFDWTDATLAQKLVIDSSHPELKSAAANFERLGRLHVSRLDGKNFFNEEYTYLAMYGGRGFSVWNADDVTMTSPVYDSAGTLEERMETAYRPVFNCDYSAKMEAYDSPENLRDTVSDDLGAKVTALDVQEDGDKTFLVLGSSSTGTLYLYTIDTSGATPQTRFQHIYRAGQTDVPWRDMYVNATAGDLYITDIGIIPSVNNPTHKPLVYVVSEGSGALSLYEIQ